jgi:hypothetical protein
LCVFVLFAQNRFLGLLILLSMRRCIVGFRLPDETVSALVQAQQTRISGIPNLTLITPRFLVVRRFECLSVPDIDFVSRTMKTCDVPQSEIVLSGLQFTPSAKKARFIVVPTLHKVRETAFVFLFDFQT